MQVKNLAFARQEIVFDVEPVHGLKMSPKNSDGNQIGNGRGLIVAFFDGVQRLLARLQILLVLRRTNARRGRKGPSSSSQNATGETAARFPRAIFSRCAEIRRQRPRPGRRCCRCNSERPLPCPLTKQADKGVAKDGVAQVSYVRSLVGIDAGMFDQNFAGRSLGTRHFSAISAFASSSRLTAR